MNQSTTTTTTERGDHSSALSGVRSGQLADLIHRIRREILSRREVVRAVIIRHTGTQDIYAAGLLDAAQIELAWLDHLSGLLDAAVEAADDDTLLHHVAGMYHHGAALLEGLRHD